MKRTVILVIAALFALVSVTTAFAYSGTKTVYAYTNTAYVNWASIMVAYSGYACSGTSFSAAASATKLTVRPKIQEDGRNAANATTFQQNSLSGGAPYFSYVVQNQTVVDIYSNTDAYNNGASITGYWTV